MKQFIATTLIIGFLFSKTFAQDRVTNDFFTQIKNYDLSTILTADTFLADEAMDFDGSIDSEAVQTIKRAEILGFIGDNYQRFHIHFIYIIQNHVNPYEYFAYGKTKVKETICSFQGTIKITKSRLYEKCYIYEDIYIPLYERGYVECEVNLYEDNKQNSVGFFSGKLISNFIIDDKGIFRYDALSFSGDPFCNNQFVGIWTSYKTKSSKKCHWGDCRIPDCGDLDIGAGYFSVKDKYVKNGWQTYNDGSEYIEVENNKWELKNKWWEEK